MSEVTPVTCTGRHGDEGGDCAPSCQEIVSCHAMLSCCHVVSCHVPTSTWTGGCAGGEARCSRWRPRWRLRRRRRGQTGSSSSPPRRRRRRGTPAPAPAPAMLLIDALLCPLLTAKLSSRDQKIESRFVISFVCFQIVSGAETGVAAASFSFVKESSTMFICYLDIVWKGTTSPHSAITILKETQGTFRNIAVALEIRIKMCRVKQYTIGRVGPFVSQLCAFEKY